MRHKIPKDFLQVYAFNMIAKAIQFLISLFIIRCAVSVDEYAIYTKYYTLVATLSGVIGESLSLTYIRYNTERISRDSKDNKDNLFLLINIINTIVFLIVTIVCMVWQAINGGENYILRSCITGFLFSTIVLIVSFFRSREKYLFSGIIEVTRYILVGIVLLIVYLFRSFAFSSISYSYILGALCAVIVGIIVCYTYAKKTSVSLLLSKSNLKLLYSVSVWMLLYNALMQFFNQTDVWMLDRFGSAYDVACYGVAFKYYSIIAGFLPAIKTILRVRMSKAENVDSLERQQAFAKKWIRQLIIPSVGIALVGGMGGRILFPLLNGNSYEASITTFFVLCICAALAYLFAPSTSLVMSMSKYKTQFFYALLAFVVNIIGNYLLIPRYGSTGAAITTTLSHLVFNGSLMFVVFRTKRL